MKLSKHLFVYDLAVVTIMKNEEPYIKEWMDYHILAGVDHFYIYDNEDEQGKQREILQPYIDKGIVTYIFYPGKARQYEAYNEAVKNYRFLCRYMTFIDADEFIFPKDNKTIVEVVDEIMDKYPEAAALAVNIHNFGSSGYETADYDTGVLDRFVYRRSDKDVPLLPKSSLPGGNAHVSTIANPRKIKLFYNPHFAVYYDGCFAINENGDQVDLFYSDPPSVNKIVMNHYSVKSKEEYMKKIERGTADAYHNIYKMEKFKNDDVNDIYDDEITDYRDYRKSVVDPSDEGVVNTIKPLDLSLKLIELSHFLLPFTVKEAPYNYHIDKMEGLLICRALASYLGQTILDEHTKTFYEELSLSAVLKTLHTEIRSDDLQMFIAEMPKLLQLQYPVVDDIRKCCINFMYQINDMYRVYDRYAWEKFAASQYVIDLLEAFKTSKRKKKK